MQPVTESSSGTSRSQGFASSPDSFAAVLAQLTDRARTLAESGGRTILGVTGPPGVGKSTVCAMLAARLGADATLVGMDGFHLAGAELIRLGAADRKGAPDTFDVDGYVALLRRIRSQTEAVVYAPRFERALEESIAAAVPIALDTPLIITEGNYLLLDSGGWQNVRAELDQVWYLDADDETRVQRLIQRHQSFGRSAEQARQWTFDVDLRNAHLIENTRSTADLVIEVPDTTSARQDEN